MEDFNSLHKGQVRKRAVHKEQTWKSDESQHISDLSKNEMV